MRRAATCLQCPPLLEANAGHVQVDANPLGVSCRVTLYGSASVPRTDPRAAASSIWIPSTAWRRT